MPAFPTIDCTQSVRAIIATHPATESVLRHHGINTRSDNTMSIEQAAHVAGADPAVLCQVLRAAALAH